MGGGGDEAHVARLPARAVVGRDGQQARVLALRAGVGLHRERVIAGDPAQLPLQVLHHLGIPGGLMGRGVRVERAELGPGQGHHLGGGVELHRAGAERDHGPVEGEVAVAQPAHVAHHLRLCPVHVEHGVGQVVADAQQSVGDGGLTGQAGALVDAERVQDPADHLQVGGLVHGDAHPVAADAAQVHAPVLGRGEDARLPNAHAHGDGVEERLGLDLGAVGAQCRGQGGGHEMGALGDGPQPDWAMEHRIERGHHGQQRLGGADVRRGLLPSDVLLAGLQRQPVGAGARGVDRDADEAAGHGPLQLVAAGHERGVGPAEAHGHAEALRGADGDVRAHGPGLLEHAERQKVGRDDRDASGGADRCAVFGQVADVAVCAGVSEDRPA